jgi:hypothetical protein
MWDIYGMIFDGQRWERYLSHGQSPVVTWNAALLKTAMPPAGALGSGMIRRA